MSSAGGGGAMAMFDLSPHKVAVCNLIQVFCPPSQSTVPVPFRSVAHHNRVALFLFSLTRSCEDFIEPTLDELVNQIKGISASAGDWFSEWLGQHLTERLQSFSSPDDLFTFFDKLRSVLLHLSGADYGDDRIILDPNSHLGYFLRCCILTFNGLTFEGVCHLLTNIGEYCNSADTEYAIPEDDYECPSELRGFLDDENLDFENDAYNVCSHDSKAESIHGRSSSNIRLPKSIFDAVKDINASVDCKFGNNGRNVDECSPDNMYKDDYHQGELYLRSKWQLLGYMNEQADLLEKHSNLCSTTSFGSIIKQLQKLAPELHRVRFLQYLNDLYHNDYIAALDNLHRFFDCSGGVEGISNYSQISSMSDAHEGRYQSALLCLGIMHCHFGQSKPALEVLTDAVRIAQVKNDDSCLAYTLAAICDLLSQIRNPSTTGIIGSSYTLGTGMGLSMPMSTQQQLLVLLKSSLKRAEVLKLTRLVAFNRLALAKFDLKNVRMSQVPFGLKNQTTPKTSPASVCKELRLSCFLFGDFGSDGVAVANDSGSFSTSWLKLLPDSRSSLILNKMHGLNHYDAFNCSAQPNPVPGSVLQLVGVSFLLKATSWELYGSAPLARINTLIHLSSFADAASSAELSLAYAKLIQYLMVTKGYKDAFNALKMAEKKGLSFSKSHVHLLKLQLLHERALHKGLVKFALQLCDELSVLASPAAGVDMELKTEASLRRARTLLAANQFSQAASAAHSLFRACYEYNLHIERAVVLLLFAEIHKKSGNPVLGLPYALASLSFSQSLNLDLLEASATLAIAELWLCIGASHSKRALRLVYQSLPMILGHGGLELRSRANITMAKCHLSDPSFSVSNNSDIVLNSLRQAAEELEILEYHEMAAEAFYLMAMVYNMLGKVQEREQAAISFKKHIIAMENPMDEEELRNEICSAQNVDMPNK